MPPRLPLFLDTGSIEVFPTSSRVIDYKHFPYSSSASFHATTLPDPYYEYTQSTSVSNSTTSDVTASSFSGPLQDSNVVMCLTMEHTIGVRTAVNTVGPRITLSRILPEGGVSAASTIKVASTTTAFTIAAEGTNDVPQTVLTPGLAVANTTYPAYTQGIFTGLGSFYGLNVILQSETAGTSVTIASGSYYAYRFAGYESSLYPPTQSSQPPLQLLSGSLRAISGSDTVSTDVLPPTASQWLSQSLATNISTTSNSAFTTVFTLSGLTNGKRYLVNFYLVARSAATGTGFRMRAINGNNYLGVLYVPTSNTAFSISSSVDGTNITNANGGTWPTANADRLAYGEYIVTKAAGTDPLIQILSETNGTAVTAQSGSVVFYRAIE